MKITLLGTGDAVGTPKIGCRCLTCKDALSGGRSRRTRFSIMVESGKGIVLIDTSPDMRRQLLKKGVSRVDAVIWTHAHYDHYAGFGDFHRIQNNVNVYAAPGVLDYILNYMYFMRPARHDVTLYEPFDLLGLEFTIFEVYHPPLEISTGVMIREGEKKVVITGDTRKDMPERTLEIIQSPDLLIADAIVLPGYRVEKHMNSQEAMELASELRAKKVVFTHISHLFPPHDKSSRIWPLGYDGMEIEI